MAAFENELTDISEEWADVTCEGKPSLYHRVYLLSAKNVKGIGAHPLRRLARILAALLLMAGGWETGTALGAEGSAPPPANLVDEGINSADVAWMLVSSAFVLMMAAPGLALFYGGLVRKKNILSVMMQCIFLMGMMSVIWATYGYSLSFGKDVLGGVVGGGDYVLLKDVAPVWVGSEGRELEREVEKTDADGKTSKVKESYVIKNAAYYPKEGTVPRLVHMIFQMMFFMITPALICGAFAERMKFSAMVLFSALWGTFVYCPLAHWVWGATGWLSSVNPAAPFGAFDFAGGTVVHISSGVSALVCCLVIGKRLGFPHEPMPPHNLTYTFIGATLLWMGWFGFNAGSALSSGVAAVNAFVATHLAAAAGVIAWAGLEWIFRGKPSILGACSGAVAGLVCITPACGVVTPQVGMLLGLAAGCVCYWACTTLKHRFKYDDSLDAFGVHGVGGTLGAILTGVFATKAVTGVDAPQGLLEGNTMQLVNQAVGVLAAAGVAVVGSLILLKIIDATIGLRVTQDEELRGLDITQHGEEGYIFH